MRLRLQANEAQAKLDAARQKIEDERWAMDYKLRAGEADRKKAKDAADATGSPSGKLQNLRRVIGPDGKEAWLGQNSEGAPYLQGGSEPVDVRDYDDALSETQVAAATKKLTDDVRDVLGLRQALTTYTQDAPYAVGGENPTPYEDIPGRGRFSGREGVTGYAARLYEYAGRVKAATPGDLYAVGREIANMKIREAAGLSQTSAEIERVRPVLEGEFGI